ncbi:MAG: T9SS type A sorting domain-containing protein [Calditrichaeota bacterium]|nr:T9SS type A sorting domain-containing protein [Calditrichota bacterium]
MKQLSFALALLAVLLLSQPSDGTNYFWLTNFETSSAFPGDLQRFFGRDTLWGPVHSNDYIATQNVGGLPVVMDALSTSKPSFRPGSPNPAFIFRDGPPQFNVGEIAIPRTLTHWRELATEQNHFFNIPGHVWYASISNDVLALYSWPEGTEFDSTTANLETVAFGVQRTVVFVDGKLDLRGAIAPEGVELMLGASENIRLVGDVKIIGTDETSGELPEGATSRVAIASEQAVLIANTWENGRENRAQGADIVITALLYALNDVFQIEQMNDIGDDYVCTCTPDERGTIVLTGGITQNYRGYVHRSNRGGTGYAKRYHYDERLRGWRTGVFQPFVDGEEWASDADDSGVLQPSSYSLSAYPNPFNPQTTITFALPQAGNVSLKVYDVLGSEVATLLDGHMTAGAHDVNFSGSNLPSGVYFVQLASGDFTTTQKLLLLK